MFQKSPRRARRCTKKNFILSFVAFITFVVKINIIKRTQIHFILYQTSVKSVGGALSKGLNFAFSLALA
jgi:hypothetical protein